MKTTKLQLAILAASALASVATVQANLVTGSIWELGSSSAVDAALPANIPGTAANVTFSVNTPINFDSRNAGNGYTIGGFLSTGGANILTGAGEAGNTLNNTIFQFLGQVTVTHNQTFSVEHDDGLTLIIGGLDVIGGATFPIDAGPTAPNLTTRTYTGPSGTFNFQLVYLENRGAPGVLQIDLPLSAVPEPSTYVAGSLMLLPFGASALRIFRKKQVA